MISTKSSKLIIFMLTSLLSLSCLADGNYALNSMVTSSGEVEGQPAKNVVDGSITSSWNSGDFPIAWVEIDLGAVRRISEIRGIVDQFPTGDSVHNIYLDGKLKSTWKGITKKGEVLSWTPSRLVTARKIKIETTEVDSWVAWFEIAVIGPDSTNPIPGVSAPDNIVTLSDNLDFNIPILDFESAEKQHSFFTANFQHIGANEDGRLLWKLKDFAPVNNSPERTIPSFIFGASNLAMKLNLIQFGTITYWADFVFIGDNGEPGDLVWLMTNVGAYE